MLSAASVEPDKVSDAAGSKAKGKSKKQIQWLDQNIKSFPFLFPVLDRK